MGRPVNLHPEDRQATWGASLESLASDALDVTERRMGLSLDAAPTLRSFAPEAAFYESLGRRPHRIVAVALSDANRIVINRGPFLSMSRYRRRQVLIHEFAHLIIGRRIPSSLPRWLDEGLAMIVSKEEGIQGSMRVAIAASFGGLVPLHTLWGGSQAGVIDQDLAYAQSLSATRYFIDSGAWGPYGPRDGLPELFRKLAHPTQGRALRDLLNDPGFIRAFERRWRESLRTFWNWVAALTSGGVFWVGISGLFLLAYWRKRRMTQAIEDAWDTDEPIGEPIPAPYSEDEMRDMEQAWSGESGER